MSTHFLLNQNFSLVDCAECHMAFLIPAAMEDRLRKSHETFHCPAGHKLSFQGKSAEERLQEELAAEKRRVATRDQQLEWEHQRRQRAERRCRAVRGVVTRLKNKAGQRA